MLDPLRCLRHARFALLKAKDARSANAYRYWLRKALGHVEFTKGYLIP